ncbi:nucleoid-associated protein [Bacillus sp. DJP31]|uniref:nucleoid-associated protein n=1 Tax=Bacillus sp. DJP31 TaxID=3409789 RepID=UPI003BB5FCD6
MAQIAIKNLIAHDIDLDQKAPSPATNVIDLTTSSEEVLKFFSDHVKTAHTTKQIKVCRFSYENAQVLFDSNDIAKNLEDNDMFISATADMTHRLFNIMKSSSTKSSGAMIYLVYEDLSDSTHYLGIMKMDPNKGIQYNKTTNSFIVQSNMLPNAKDRLHKTAFIKLKEGLWNEDVHLFVLDKQQTNETVSKFFLISFLEAEVKINDTLVTELVEKKLVEMARTQKITNEPLDPMGLLDFSSKVDRMLSSHRDIDLDHELDSLLKTYIPGDGDRELKIEDIKLALREENEGVYFQFKANKKPSFAEYTDVQNQIKFKFPLALKGKKVFIETKEEDGQKVMTIRLEGIDLVEKFK